MAAVLSFEAHTAEVAPTREQAEAGFEVVLTYLGSLPARKAVPLIGRLRGRLDAAEARSLATQIGDDGATKTAEAVAAGDGKTTKRSRKRAAKRAAAVKKNDKIADKMDTGELSGEQVDVLADAESKTDGASISDDELIDQVAAVNPDQGAGVIEDYLANNSDANREQSRHERQRSKRRVSRFRTKDDCEALLIAGSTPLLRKLRKRCSS